MVRTDPVAQLDGAICLGLMAQECYYQGELVESANVVFFRTAPARWLRFFIDCGSFGISVVESASPIPPEATDPEFRYPLVDLGACYPVIGRRVVTAMVHSTPSSWADAAELVLTFEDGAALALVNRDEVSSIEYRPAAG